MQISYREAMRLDLPVLVSMERTLFSDSPWSMGQFKEEFSGIPKTNHSKNGRRCEWRRR